MFQNHQDYSLKKKKNYFCFNLIRITPRLMNFEDNQEGKSSFSLVLFVILSHRLCFLVATKVAEREKTWKETRITRAGRERKRDSN